MKRFLLILPSEQKFLKRQTRALKEFPHFLPVKFGCILIDIEIVSDGGIHVSLAKAKGLQ